MGRVLCDAFYHCNYYLLKKAAKLKSITGCIVNLEITSTWEKGVKKIYHMKGHEIDFQSDKESEQSFFDTSTGNVTYETPKKWKQKEKVCVLFVGRLGKWFLLLDCVHRKNMQMQEYCSLQAWLRLVGT